MSELYADDPFLKALEQAAGNTPKAPLAELTDPATGRKVAFDDPAKLQEAVQTMYNQAMAKDAEARELSAKLAAIPQTPAKPETKPKAAKPDNEKLLAEFQKRTEFDAVDGMDYFTSNLPTVQKQKETIEALLARMGQFEQALSTTVFLGKNKEVAQSPEAQKVIGQILSSMVKPNETANPDQMDIALHAAKSIAPQLFQPAQSQPGSGTPSGGFRESFTPAPSPPRTSSAGPSNASTNEAIEKQIDLLWSQPGGEQKVKALLESMAAQ